MLLSWCLSSKESLGHAVASTLLALNASLTGAVLVKFLVTRTLATRADLKQDIHRDREYDEHSKPLAAEYDCVAHRSLIVARLGALLGMVGCCGSILSPASPSSLTRFVDKATIIQWVRNLSEWKIRFALTNRHSCYCWSSPHSAATRTMALPTSTHLHFKWHAMALLRVSYYFFTD